MSYPLLTQKFSLTGTDIYVPIEDISNYIVSTPAATTVDVMITLEDFVVAGYLTAASTVEQLVFVDETPSDDTLTRTVGNWHHEHFVPGMNMTITGTTSNNATYLIDSISTDGKVITFDSGASITDETIAAPTGVVISGLYDDATVWITHETVAASSVSFTALEYGPTAYRFSRTGAGTCTVWVRG